MQAVKLLLLAGSTSCALVALVLTLLWRPPAPLDNFMINREDIGRRRAWKRKADFAQAWAARLNALAILQGAVLTWLTL